jgi:hypothetical protein
MSLPLLIQGIGSIGVFTSRAFLPAFAAALLLRFGPHVPWLARTGLLARVQDVPTWFTSDASLIILGLLTAFELIADRVPEAKALLDEVHDYLKAGMAVLTFLGVLGATDRALLHGVVGAPAAVPYLSALAVGGGTFLAARTRGTVLGPLVEADSDDALGLQQLIRYAEDLWGSLGMLLLILLPLLALAVFGAVLILLGLARYYIERREERAKIACSACGASMYAAACACALCKAPVSAPRAVGILGGTKAAPADSARHPFRLAAVGRCPVCASPLGRRLPGQACPACGSPVLAEPRFAWQYLDLIDRRVPLVCVACLLLGLIPILGVIPAVILYRLELVAPLRRYLPRGKNFLLRWTIRLVSLVLIALQWVPILGGLLLPILALVNYGPYRRAFQKSLPALTLVP